MGFLKFIRIVSVLYSYETLDGTNIVIEHNNTIYMWDMMKYYLANTLQSEYNEIHVNIRTKKYYIDESGDQTVDIPDYTIVSIL